MPLKRTRRLQSKFKPYILQCPFKCGLFCKSTSGLTQHKNVCSQNPAYRRLPSPPPRPQTPQTPPRGSPNHTFETPRRHTTPQHGSPQRQQWVVNGRGAQTKLHPYIDGRPCDSDGYDIPEGTPPPPEIQRTKDDYFPYSCEAEFELADFLFRTEQMSGKKISKLMEIWATFQQAAGVDTDVEPPFTSAQDMYDKIDATEVGDVGWQAFSLTFSGNIPEGSSPPSWKCASYEVWYRDPLKIAEGILSRKDFKDELDYAPKRVFNRKGDRVFSDFMSGNWAWDQTDTISEDPETHGSMFVPIVLGSDKTTVSVATGHNQFYPLYASIGNIHNQVRRAHRNAVSVVGFLAIPHADKASEEGDEFRQFRRQVFHESIARILGSLRPWMTKPRITRCGDGHYRRVIYGLGPYIADYPEQALLSCIVQGWCPKCTAHFKNLDGDPTAIPRSREHREMLMEAFGEEPAGGTLRHGYGIISDVMPFTSYFPRADIHELLSPDILHQVVKGAFKDNLVDWVVEYLHRVHGKAGAKEILADIDRRIAAVPLFPGLRRFPEGRGFKQWTGDDSKALMKVWLPAIAGHVPASMVRAISAFLEFSYLVRRSHIDSKTLQQIDAAIARYLQERQVFLDVGVRKTFKLPRHHSIVHYKTLIQQFGAPNGLCSSITENRHITTVKEPWRRSNRNEALGQMLRTNQRLDKLAASRADFLSRGMINGPMLLSGRVASGDIAPQSSLGTSGNTEDAEAVEGMTSLGDVQLARYGARHYPGTVGTLGRHINQPRLQEHIRRFLYDQSFPNSDICGMDVDLPLCPEIPHTLAIKVFHSATSTYYAPSDLCGTGGMHRERIRANPHWKGGARYDCVYVEQDADAIGFLGLLVARVKMFFSFSFQKPYSCALVEWFTTFGDAPCEDTGLWRIVPDYDSNGERMTSVIHIDSILRGAHIIGVSGLQPLPTNFTYSDSMDAFEMFYVNKYADHHAHEIAF